MNKKFKFLRKYTKKTFDVHLMIEPVDKFLIPFIKAGADIISFHPENVKNVDKTIKVIKSYKKKVGLVLNPNIKENKILQLKEVVKKNVDKIDSIIDEYNANS